MYIITATHPTNGETATKQALTEQDANNKYDELAQYYPECEIKITQD